MRTSFAATPEAPSQARDLLARMLAADGRREAAQLATSELITNALLHGDLMDDDRIELWVRCDGERIRVSVAHPGDGFTRDDPDPVARTAGGWGLQIVDTVASAWGNTTASDRTVVWFELGTA